MKITSRNNLGLSIFALLVSFVGSASVVTAYRFLAWVSIAVADLYLLSVLIVAAMLSDDAEFAKRHSWLRFLLPQRSAGLLIIALLLFAIVSGFAGLYVGCDVFRSSKTPLDALYISYLTMGFCDFSPKPGYGQLVVITQLFSGGLLLVGAIPLLLSRISTFKRM